MSRTPWRSRVWLAGLFDVVAGGVVGITVYLGFTEGVGIVEAGLALFNSALAIAVTLGVISDGEAKTTPTDDPLGPDLLPLLPFRQLEALNEALDAGDLDRARELVAPSSH
jgi:hypothetical protein